MTTAAAEAKRKPLRRKKLTRTKKMKPEPAEEPLEGPQELEVTVVVPQSTVPVASTATGHKPRVGTRSGGRAAKQGRLPSNALALGANDGSAVQVAAQAEVAAEPIAPETAAAILKRVKRLSLIHI